MMKKALSPMLRFPFAVVACALLLAVLPAAPTRAANLTVTPGLLIEEAWDSNIFNAPIDATQTDDFITRATPRLTLTLVSPGSAVNLMGAIEAEWYAENTDLNRNAATKLLELTTTGPLVLSPRFSLYPAARFVESRDTGRPEILIEVPGPTPLPAPDITPTETVITARTGRRVYAASLQTISRLTPNVDLELGGTFLRRDYFEGPPGLIDSRTFAENAAVLWRFSPRYSGGIFAEASQNSFIGRPNSRTYTGGLIGRYTWSEQTLIEGRAGATYRLESTGVDNEKISGWDPYALFSVAHARPGFRAFFLASYELAGAGSFGLTTKRGSASLDLFHELARDWAWDVSGAWQSNRSTDEAVSEDIITARGSAGLRYTATPWAMLRLGGTAARQWSQGPSGSDLERFSVMLGLTLTNTYLIL